MQIFLKLEALTLKYVYISVAPIKMRAEMTVKGYPYVAVARARGYHNHTAPAAESAVVEVTFKIFYRSFEVVYRVEIVNRALFEIRAAAEINSVSRAHV